VVGLRPVRVRVATCVLESLGVAGRPVWWLYFVAHTPVVSYPSLQRPDIILSREPFWDGVDMLFKLNPHLRTLLTPNHALLCENGDFYIISLSTLRSLISMYFQLVEAR